MVSAEAAPYATIGGLSQVLYYLPKSLLRLGYDVSVMVPRYGTIDVSEHKIKPFIEELAVPTGEKTGATHLSCSVSYRQGTRGEPTVYFLENAEYFGSRANIYGYADDHIRFSLLSRGLIEFLKVAKIKPAVIHCHDWHTGYLPNYLRNAYGNDPYFAGTATVFTIHNLHAQGIMEYRYATPLNFDDGKGPIGGMFSERLKKQNPMKRGIIHADLVNTVSESYAHEILTPEYGEGLHELLQEVRTKLFGVLNGLDYDSFDPSTDKVIKKNFSYKDTTSRRENKRDLQKEFGLTIDPKVPVVAYVGRLYSQKGLDLLVEVIPHLLRDLKVQLIIMGQGDRNYHSYFSSLAEEYPRRVGIHLMQNFSLPRVIYSGSDIVLMPSKFEPGGIVVMEAMRYGAVPVVRATGGLSDVVVDFEPDQKTGTGFSFHDYHPISLYGSITRALEMYKMPSLWKKLQMSVMKCDFSWDAVAEKYGDLYSRAKEFRKTSRAPIKQVDHLLLV